jgi:hypothetical protein
MVTLQSRLRIAKDILSHDLDGESVLLNLNTGVYLGLNSVGTRVWHLIANHELLETVLDFLIQEYDVTRDQCIRDLFLLVQEMQEQQLLEATT